MMYEWDYFNRKETVPMDNSLLRTIPKVDELLNLPALRAVCADVPLPALTEAVRVELDALRAQLCSGECSAVPNADTLCSRIAARARSARLPALRSVINATGVTLHTNLGRACLSERAAAAAAAAARDYSTLEYDISTGARGDRCRHIEPLLQRLTGAESAMVVNNNAAAVLLILSALAAGGEVVVSRGELVEIGGSFRIPDIMEACGAALREVGATNKTHLADYERAIGEETRALMKVHTSNFRILGFTEAVGRAELAALAHAHGLPMIEDLGSGCLTALEPFGVCGEPMVQSSVRAGVDLISFSGDKLLGGPQAGVILGKKQYIDRLKRHPLARAMRADKLTLAALEATLRAYADGTASDEIPTLRMLALTPDELRARADKLCTLLTACGVDAAVLASQDPVGGGSAPAQLLPAFAVAIRPHGCSADALERRLRKRDTPIIARVSHGCVLLGMRTLRREQFPAIAAALAEAAQ